METLLLHGFNKSGTDKLIACRLGGTFKVYNPTTGVWDNKTPTADADNQMSATNFLDYAFITNYDTNYSTTDASTFSTTTNVGDMPVGKYLSNQDLRVFVANIKIRGTAYSSRVAYSDLPKNDAITWGFETGTDLAQTANSAVITSAGSTFITRNIKVGDKIKIESGTNAGEYTVRSVDSETQLTLTTTLTNTQSSCNFWVGGNWFDVKTNDGDEITGIGNNSNEILFFKKNSLHRYNVNSKYLRQVKQVKGTTSPRSIVNMNEYTYYFYPKIGVLRYDGVTSQKISNPLADIIDGISTSMYTEVVGWSVNDEIVEFYIGTVTLRDGDTIEHCVVSLDTTTEQWSTRSLPWGIEQKTTWYQSGVPNTYISNTVGQVLKVNDGYSYASKDISFQLEDWPVFPEGHDVLLDFQRLRLYIENGMDIQVLYKLYYKPTGKPNVWTIDRDWTPLRGSSRGDKVEFVFDSKRPHRACGIAFKFIQSSSNESFLIEKYILYYSNPALR